MSHSQTSSKSHSNDSSYSRLEGSFDSFDANRIFYQIWKPQKTRATVIITHGHGEHSECYHRVVQYYANKGYEFWAWDLRGHGRSEGLRGYAASFQDYVQDFKIFLDLALKKVDRTQPLFLLSHSMGGLIQLAYLTDHDQSPYIAQVVSAPLLGLAVEVPTYKKMAAEMLEKYLPKLTLGNELNNKMLTRDPEVMLEFDKDPYRHTKMSSGVYMGIVRQIDKLMTQADQIKLPTLFQCPEKDPVCSTEATQKFSQLMNPELMKFLMYGNGARHEMYNDVHRLEVYKDMENYLESFLKGQP